eukprot:COSAG05_NODE_125_length_17331_cov_16.188058_9_plen_49_part_00
MIAITMLTYVRIPVALCMNLEIRCENRSKPQRINAGPKEGQARDSLIL